MQRAPSRSSSASSNAGLTKAIRILLVGIVLLTPLVFDLGAAKPFDSPKLATLWVLGWPAAGLWVAKMILSRERPARFLMGWLAAAFLAATALSTVLSDTPWASLFGAYTRYDGLVTVVVLVLVFFVVASTYRRDPEQIGEILWAVAIASVVMTAYVLLQGMGFDPIPWPVGDPSQPLVSNFATMGNPNFTGGYLGLTAPWAYFAFQRVRGRWRYAVVAAACAQVGAVAFTSARNGMVALVSAWLVVLYLSRHKVPTWVKLGAVAGATAIVATAILVIWHPGSEQPPAFAGRDSVFRSGTIRLRGQWWMAGLRMFASDPITGVGPETYGVRHQRHLSPDAADLPGIEATDKPHSIPVEHLAETGILGFGAFAALVAVAFARGIRRMRHLEGTQRAALIAFLGILGGYVGQSFFSIDVTALAAIEWVSLGAIAALTYPAGGPRSAIDPSKRSPRLRIVATSVVIASLLIATLGTMPVMADHELKAAADGQSGIEPFDDVAAHYRRAITFQPFEPVYHGYYGAFLEGEARKYTEKSERLPLFREAVAVYSRMNELQPGYANWVQTVGVAIGRLATVGGSEFSEAEPWLKRAMSLAPLDWRIRLSYGQLLRLWGVAADDTVLLCRAVDEFRAAYSQRPNRQTLDDLVTTYERLGDLNIAEDLLLHVADLIRARVAVDRRLGAWSKEIEARLEYIRARKAETGRPTPHRCAS